MANSKNITFDQLQAALSRVKSALDGKANASHGNHVPKTETANNARFLRNDNTWQTITPVNIGAADRSHSHGSYVNQNAFSNIKVGDTTVAADSPTDTLTLTAGANVTLTPDATNDSVTIAAKDTVYTHPTTSGYKHIPSGGSSGQILRWSADGTAAWGSDNNTDTKVTNTLNTTAKAYVTGTTSATTNTGTQVFDTGVYLDTTAGKLVATTFAGALSGNASSATQLQTARKFTIGNTERTFNGSGDVKWTLADIGAAAASHNHTSLTGVTKLQFAAGSSDSAVMKVTTEEANTYLDFEMNDDINTDMYRWRFSAYESTGATPYFNLMTLTAKDGSSARLTVNGDVTASSFTGNASSATKLQTARAIKIGNTSKNFDGTANATWTLAEIGAAASGHTHNKITSRGKVAAETGTTRPAVDGLSMAEVYNNEYPTAYGNAITLKGQGDGQILVGWSGSSGGHAPVYVRSKRDTADANWSGWAQFYTSANPQPSVTGNAGTATKLAVAKTITIGNTGKSFDGSGNISWSLDEIGAVSPSHTHDRIIDSNNSIIVAQANDHCGLDAVNNVNVATWYGFSISNNCSNTDNYGQVTFSVDARSGQVWTRGTVNAPGFSGALYGNANTATTLANSRKFTIGNTERYFNGSADVSWTLDEMGVTSAITQSGNSILNTVSNTYATKAELNDLSIGGRNYYTKTSSIFALTSEGTITRDNSINGFVLTAGDNGNVFCRIVCIWEGYKYYTVSGYFKADTQCNANIDVCDYDIGNKSVPTTYTKFSGTAYVDRATDDIYNFVDIQCYGVGAGNKVYIKDFKVEEGQKATSWTPAPEDVDNSINAVDNKFANYSTTNQMNSAIQVAENDAKMDIRHNYVTKHEAAHYFEGENKWKLDVYSLGSMSANATPTKELMIQNNCQYQRSYLVEHPSYEGDKYGDNYVGYATTYMHFTENYQWTGRVVTDDNGNVYLNDVLVLSTPTCQWTNITLNFKAGWNKLEVLYAEGGGGDGWQFDSEIVVVPGGIMNKMNCYGQNSTEEYLKANYSTTQQMNSAIEQKANEITSSVSQTYTTKTDFDKLATGQNKWLLEMFEKGEGIDGQSPITIKDIMGKALIKAILVDDSVTSNQSQFGESYLGRATTYVYLDEDYSWETTATSDDGSTIYINGAAIATLGSCAPTPVTVPFKQGWNKITWVYNEGIGGDGWDFSPRLTTLSQVKYMNAYPMTNVDEVGNILDSNIKTVSSKQATLEQNLDVFKQNAGNWNATTASRLQSARTLTIGNTGKNFDGSGNVSWSLGEIGAAASGHTHDSITGGNTYITTVGNDTYSLDMPNNIDISSWFGVSITNNCANTENYRQTTVAINARTGEATLRGGITAHGAYMTNNIVFSEAGTSYSNSPGLTWNGSTDGADLYYRTLEADQGQLLINLRDDSNATLAIAWDGEVKATFDSNGYYSGNANTATKLKTARSIGVTGAVSGSANFDGSGNISIITTYCYPTPGNFWNDGAMVVNANTGVAEAGIAIDFHLTSNTNDDYHTRLLCAGNNKNIVNLPTGNGTLALTTDNVASATKLQTARNIKIGNTSRSFNGTGDVTWTLSDIGAAAANHTHSYTDSNHNHDDAYLKLSGGTLSGELFVDNNVYSKAFCVRENGKELWFDIGDNDTYIWASGANKSLQITHSGDLNFDGQPVLYGGRGNNYDTATNSIYFNNSGTSHKGRISCYNEGGGDYIQLALRTADASDNYIAMYADTTKFKQNNIYLGGKKLTIATSAPSNPASGDVWINIG